LFLEINGLTVNAEDDALVDLVLRTAQGQANKQEIASSFGTMFIPNSFRPNRMLILAGFLLVALGQGRGLALAETGWGDLQMRFTLEGAPPPVKKLDLNSRPECSKLDLVDETLVVNAKGGIKNVFVWLVSEPKAVHRDVEAAAKRDIIIHIQGCRYEPRATVVAVNQVLHIKNQDPFGHNTRFTLMANEELSRAIPTSSVESKSFSNSEISPGTIDCYIHPWMSGHILIRPNLYASISNRDGLVTIAKLPAGKHTFCAWSERYLQGAKLNGQDAGWKKGRFEVEIKDGETTRLDVTVAPEVILGKRKLQDLKRTVPTEGNKGNEER
jgi:hypothetical protein